MSFHQALADHGIVARFPGDPRDNADDVGKMAKDICGTVAGGTTPEEFDNTMWWSVPPHPQGQWYTKLAITYCCPQHLSREYWSGDVPPPLPNALVG
jgi:hypothetical protein